MSWHGSSALIWDLDRLRAATDAAGVALWSWNVDTDEIALDARARALWGVSTADVITFKDLSSHIHPADVNRVRSAFNGTRDVVGLYEIDFRILHGVDIRWVSARGQGDDQGIVDRIMFGVFLDVTDRKQAEETREILAVEMSHRIKNLFAIVSSLTSLAARSAITTTDMAKDLIQRVSALGRAHDLVRPVGGRPEMRMPLLGGLFVVLLAPYADAELGSSRVHVLVPDIGVGETAVTALALVVHELATNSAKYGALSTPGGRLEVSSTSNGDHVVITWTERGGPPVSSHRGPRGFGSKLVERTMSGQLGGSIVFDWQVEGVVVTLRMSKARLAA